MYAFLKKKQNKKHSPKKYLFSEWFPQSVLEQLTLNLNWKSPFQLAPFLRLMARESRF